MDENLTALTQVQDISQYPTQTFFESRWGLFSLASIFFFEGYISLWVYPALAKSLFSESFLWYILNALLLGSILGFFSRRASSYIFFVFGAIFNIALYSRGRNLDHIGPLFDVMFSLLSIVLMLVFGAPVGYRVRGVVTKNYTDILTQFRRVLLVFVIVLDVVVLSLLIRSLFPAPYSGGYYGGTEESKKYFQENSGVFDTPGSFTIATSSSIVEYSDQDAGFAITLPPGWFIKYKAVKLDYINVTFALDKSVSSPTISIFTEMTTKNLADFTSEEIGNHPEFFSGSTVITTTSTWGETDIVDGVAFDSTLQTDAEVALNRQRYRDEFIFIKNARAYVIFSDREYVDDKYSTMLIQAISSFRWFGPKAHTTEIHQKTD